MRDIHEKEDKKFMGLLKGSAVICENCTYFFYDGPQLDQPYPEYGCLKDIWTGGDPGSMNEPIECAKFKRKIPTRV